MDNNFTTENSNQFIVNNFDKETIDLQKVFNTIKRKKKLITIITLGFLTLATLRSIIKPLTYQGEFEIVLDEKQNKLLDAQMLQNNAELATLVGIGSSNNSLTTDITILKSPLILKPVYDFVIENKRKQGVDTSKFSFSNWRKNKVSAELLEGTSVLNVSYKDVNQDLILNVLDRISLAYQDYSKKTTEDMINKTMDYFNEQISIYASIAFGSI